MQISVEGKELKLTIKEDELKALIFSIAGDSIVQCVKEYPNHINEKGIIGCVEKRLVKIVENIKNVFKESSDNEYILHEINEGKNILELSVEEMINKNIYQRTKYLGLVIYAAILRKVEEENIQDAEAQGKIAIEVLDGFVKNIQKSTEIILYGVEQEYIESVD